MPISIGDRLPAVTLKTRTPDGTADLDMAEFTRGRKVVIFGVPGAFTPTCHLNHLPGFIEHADTIKARGVDAIAVISVNDHHVMGAWAKATNGEGRIEFIADMNAEFTKAIGMDQDLTATGLGIRSRRYSMIVEDGVVTQFNLEVKPGQAEISGAAALLAQL